MPFRPTFDCLWCGRAHTVRDADDLEGYAQLCPDCLGRAGDNGFLRARLKAALAERGASRRSSATTFGATPAPAVTRGGATEAEADMRAYYAARAGEYDDWYLRRGRYSHGPIHDTAWQAELEAASEWLDRLPLGGEIVELAAGTGWWSPILAGKGELWAYDAVEATLDRARERLLAHGLRSHLHVRDAWDEPDRQVDALFTGFWLSHVTRERLTDFLGLARRWLRPGGTFAFIDSLPDPMSGAADQGTWAAPELAIRRLADGREFRIPKIYYRPAELERAILESGFERADVGTSGRFFILGSARA